MADDRFRCGADHERLFKLFAAAVGYHGQLGRETGNVGFFLVDETAGNQQRKCGVDVPRGLEAAIEGSGNVLPQGPAVGTHDHAAANRRVIRELGTQYQLVVPLEKSSERVGSSISAIRCVALFRAAVRRCDCERVLHRITNPLRFRELLCVVEVGTIDQFLVKRG